MHIALYNIFIRLYILAANVLAFWKPKAKLLIDGRKGLLERITKDFENKEHEKLIWFHCASLGEFEQGRPLIEAMKAQLPSAKIMLTFFSPSGYEVRKNYTEADFIYYLPFDTASNAQQFIAATEPDFAVFVKYELWYHYLKTLNSKAIPTILISAIFQERHAFFKWHGALQRQMLRYITQIFVQNESSQKLLAGIAINNVSIAGDTRIDRALDIANAEKHYPAIEKFKGVNPLIVAGSTWVEDEILLQETMNILQSLNVKLIVAPHEIHAEHIRQIEDQFKTFKPILYSKANATANYKVLIMDNIGHLAFIYRYADFVWIGGGFNKTGIHNSIEAAVYNKALCWGPRYNRYQEAIDLVGLGAAQSCKDSASFAHQIEFWLSNKDEKEKAEQAAQQYIISNKGATEIIMDYIKLQRIF